MRQLSQFDAISWIGIAVLVIWWMSGTRKGRQRMRQMLMIGLAAIAAVALALWALTATGRGQGMTELDEDTPARVAIRHAAQANNLSEGFMFCLAFAEVGEDLKPPPPGEGFYRGLFQFDPETWKRQRGRFGFEGYSPEHLWANAHVAAGLIDELGQTEAMYRQWPPARRCGNIRRPVVIVTPSPSPTPYKDLDLG